MPISIIYNILRPVLIGLIDLSIARSQRHVLTILVFAFRSVTDGILISYNIIPSHTVFNLNFETHFDWYRHKNVRNRILLARKMFYVIVPIPMKWVYESIQLYTNYWYNIWAISLHDRANYTHLNNSFHTYVVIIVLANINNKVYIVIIISV